MRVVWSALSSVLEVSMVSADDLWFHEPVRISFLRQEFCPQDRQRAFGFYFNLVAGTRATIELRCVPNDGTDETKTRTLPEFFAGVPWRSQVAVVSSYTGDTSVWTPPGLPDGNYYKAETDTIQIPFVKRGSIRFPEHPYGEWLNQQDTQGINLNAPMELIYPPTHVIIGMKEYYKNLIYLLWQIHLRVFQVVTPFKSQRYTDQGGSKTIVPFGQDINPLIASVRITLTTVGPSVGTLVGSPVVYKAGQVAFGYR